MRSAGMDLEEGVGEEICRSCFDRDPSVDLISPCSCSGSVKYVHRNCLNQWRAVSMNPDAFWRCEICHTPYRMMIKRQKRTWAHVKFGFFVARDFLLVLIVLNLLVLGMGWIGNAIWQNFETYVVNLSFLEKSIFIRLYCFGGVLSLFLLGLFGICYFIYSKCCRAEEEVTRPLRHTEYNYRGSWGSNFYFIWCGDPYYHTGIGPCSGDLDCVCCCMGNSVRPHGIHRPHHGCSGNCNSCDCDCGSCSGGACSGCDCSGGGDMGEGAVLLLVVAVIVVIIVCLIGLFFGIFLATILGTRIVHRHLHVIARENEANIYVVADLENPQEVACADEDEERVREEGDPIMKFQEETESLIPSPDPLKSEKLLDE